MSSMYKYIDVSASLNIFISNDVFYIFYMLRGCGSELSIKQLHSNIN